MSNSPLIATRRMDASITLGMFFIKPVRNKRHKAIAADANNSDNGVFAPALLFTADCDKPPVTG